MFDWLQRADESTRRDVLSLAAKSCLGVSILPLANEWLFSAEPTRKKPARKVIYLFMEGAMSQLDTFDPKPESQVQGATGVIKTAIPGVQFSEHFPNLAGMAKKLAVVRSLNTETGAHEPGRYLMRTNYKKIASTRHPGLGAWIHKMSGRLHPDLPPSVSIGGGVGPGYLGAEFAPVPVGDPSDGLQNTTSPKYLSEAQFDHRMSLINSFDTVFKRKAKISDVSGYDDLYRDAINLLKSKDLVAFDITKEPESAQKAYGESRLGQGCLLARRLIEHNVRFVEVTLGGWDLHNELFENLPPKATELDAVVSTLLKDLESKGLLSDTLVVLGTEFGRKPKPNVNSGRDHHPAAFSCLLAGGGVQGGQVHGKTDSDAFYVEDDSTSVQDFNATIAYGLGLPVDKEIFSPDGRPFTIANGGKPLTNLF
ncbi:MAG: DUF1501 domain-containing protein [Planctomycetaceae bacterium]|nr:DUF1501 domain-containing protein [Planctomycetaceae bacterium]